MLQRHATFGLSRPFLFACVIDELLAARAGINVFSELAVRLSPSQRDYGFAPRSGGRVLS